MRPRLFGVDFTSRPSRRKAIVVAEGRLEGNMLTVSSCQRLEHFPAFEAFLQTPGPWLGGFDFPFGFSRTLVEAQGWPNTWPALMASLSVLPADTARAQLTERFRAWCGARPAGQKFAHRATDGPAGSSPSMKWVNPPVAWMLLEGATRLWQAGVTVPGMHVADPARIALEAYPGYLARRITRASYKSDEKAKQTPVRTAVRATLLAALAQGVDDYPRVKWEDGLEDAALADASGDTLDAALCLVQAAWAEVRRTDGFGLPPFDPLEGWTVSVPPAA